MENIQTLLAAVAQTQGFDDDEPDVKTGSGDTHPSTAVDAPPPPPAPSAPVQPPPTAATLEKKRGRPKGQLAAKPPLPKRSKPEDEEEDVCFICFDGGSLVLCDRKGCPKAYHPACIKRDESFFQSKAKWNCGWHICSLCRKTSHYSCYTCTYSLCKACTNVAPDYVCVRGKKGFCSICMKTIMLIEKKDEGNADSVQVDFDDNTSWEYLFKLYWVILKEKLSLKLEELTRAKSPSNGVPTLDYKPVPINRATRAASPPVPTQTAIPISQTGSENSESKQLETSPPCTRLNAEKTNHDIVGLSEAQKPIMDEVKDEPNIEKPSDPQNCQFGHKTEAARDPIVEVLERRCLCKHANKEADEPPVRAEWATKDLLEFVSHMKNGNTTVISRFDAHALLLDYVKRNSLRDPHRRSQIVCDQRLRNLFGKPRVGHVEILKLLESHFLVEEDSISSRATNGRKRKKREPRRENKSDECTETDTHNMNSIYLRRSVIENLARDGESFASKVLGSIVRIQISSSDQNPQVHRLVRVVGTTKVDEQYKVGHSTADFMLEVFNLDRKEVVSINAVSDEEFTEGELQNEAVALQPAMVDEWMQTEISRLNHLRDGASENGCSKEVHVDKLQLLQSSDSRRISDIREVHVDAKLNSDYESGEVTESGHDSEAGIEEATIETENRARKKIDTCESSRSDEHTNPDDTTNSDTACKDDQAVQSCGIETSTVTAPLGDSDSPETEKLWHYRGPNSKIQGPFSMAQLRKWITTGRFPPDMRIWKNHEQRDSLLLVDALNSGPRQEDTGPGPGPGPDLASNMAHITTFDNDIGPVKEDTGSGSWPECWDLLKDDDRDDDSSNVDNNADTRDWLLLIQNVEKGSNGPSESPNTSMPDLENQSKNEGRVCVVPPELLKSLNIELGLDDAESGPVDNKPNEIQQPQPEIPIHNFEILELLSPTHRPNNETKFEVFPDLNSAQVWSNLTGMGLGEAQLNDWCGYSPVAKPSTVDVGPPPSNNWLTSETIEFDSLGEEYVSDLLAQVDAMELQRGPLPNGPAKFDLDLMEDCGDCFSSIEQFSRRSDALSSTAGDVAVQLGCGPAPLPPHQQQQPKPAVSTFDFMTRSSVHSSASSEGETTNHASECGPCEVGPPGPAADGAAADPGWGNINLVTVQGNVNLVLGGPAGLGVWSAGQGSSWVGPSVNPSLPWVDGSHRKYGGERFSNPREWGYGGAVGGSGGRQLPWGVRPRPMIHKGQRVCKFYESGRCRKGAFCDYLHQ